MSRLDYVAKALTNFMQVIRGTVHCHNINESSKEEWLHFQQDCSIALNDGPLPQDQGWYLGRHRPERVTDNLGSMLDFELEHGQLSNFQLRLVDRHSMAHSLEVRVPFLGRTHRSEANRLPLRLEAVIHNGRKRLHFVKQPISPTCQKTSCVDPNFQLAEQLRQACLRRSLANDRVRLRNCWRIIRLGHPCSKAKKNWCWAFGLFEALHLMKTGIKTGKSIDSLLTEVLSPYEPPRPQPCFGSQP